MPLRALDGPVYHDDQNKDRYQKQKTNNNDAISVSHIVEISEKRA